VTVSSGNCSSSASVNVVVSPSITVTGISSSAVQCGAANGSATANVQGGTGALTYNWNPTGQTTSTATGLNAGGNYTVTISDAIGCSLTTTVNVVALNAPFVTVAGNTSLCIGDAATLTASGGNTYSWSTGSTATTITITPGVTTNYTVTATIGNCVDTATFAVSVLPPPIANIASNTTICAGQSATLTASGGGLYAWNNGATTSAITISPSTNTAYSVTVSIGSCSTTANASVNVVPVPTPTITATNTLICGGDRTTLTASGGTTYSWSNGMTSSSIAVTPSATTTYAVTSGNGVCTDTATVKITVLPPPIATVSGNNNLCQGNAATLTASGGGTYSWSSGQTTAVINPSTAGSYSVVVTIGTCRDTATSTVTVNPNPAATVSPDVIIIQGQSTTLTASGGTNYVWDNGMNGNPITVSPLSTTNYCVTVYDANNCKDTACVTVIVERCSDAGTLYLPNAFSPNGDGANDSLQIFYGIPQCVKSFHLVIYNRWGEKVYETGDPAFKWDGIYDKGLLLGTGEANTEVFTYYMNVEILDGSKVARKGNISLVR
jgi:gliding motility-associated-like protein